MKTQTKPQKLKLPISNVQASARRLKITWVGGYREQWTVNKLGETHKLKAVQISSH